MSDVDNYVIIRKLVDSVVCNVLGFARDLTDGFWIGLLHLIHSHKGRDSVVGITTGYGLDDRMVGVRVPVGSRIFSTSSRPALGSTQPPIQWVTGALSPKLKRQGREADDSPPANAEVKKVWIYTFTPPAPSWRSA
jgi:hypothetical protein